jgi:hypothetical protein
MLALDVLRSANITFAAALMAKAHVPGDLPEDHEDNTYGLPGGAPIRRTLRRFFKLQLRRIVGFAAKIGAEIPARFPSLADYNDPMASAMTPIMGVYWDRAGKALNGRLGLDPEEWRVTDPNLHKAIARQSYRFCAATNATTDLKLHDALVELRHQFHAGLVTRGETVEQLTKRVQSIFKAASDSRARMIAQTEASRAVHEASEMSAIASGVVSAKKLLLSANSCPVCVAVARRAESVPLGGSFGTVGHSSTYSDIRMPPIHPHCRCSVAYVLADPEAADVPAYVPRPPKKEATP